MEVYTRINLYPNNVHINQVLKYSIILSETWVILTTEVFFCRYTSVGTISVCPSYGALMTSCSYYVDFRFPTVCKGRLVVLDPSPLLPRGCPKSPSCREDGEIKT